MGELRPYEVYEVKPSAGSFKAIYLGKATSARGPVKHTILCRSKGGTPKLYRFKDFRMDGNVIDDVILESVVLKRFEERSQIEYCNDLLNGRRM